MGKLYLIRHGQTDSNSGKQLQGRIDYPLNAEGLRQARAMTAYMSSVKLDAIYCSSMLRARMTAAPLALSHNLPYRCTELLQEMSFGEWEGLPLDEIGRRWPREMELFLTRPGEWQPPGGETFAEAVERSKKALAYIFSQEGHDKDIAVVSHGGLIRCLLCVFLGLPLNNFWKLCVHNVSVSVIREWDGNFMAENINVRNFLREDKALAGSSPFKTPAAAGPSFGKDEAAEGGAGIL